MKIFDKQNIRNLVVLLSLTVGIISCKKEDDPGINEEELITTLRVSLKETGTNTTKVFEFTDPDGEGGNPPTKFDPIILDANKNYTCNVQVFNESVTPAEDITFEVSAEAEDHQFYFEPLGVNINVSNLNTDGNGLPVGITSTWVTGAASNGTIRITLKHKPGTKAAGDPTSKGETDVEVNFTATVL